MLSERLFSGVCVLVANAFGLCACQIWRLNREDDGIGWMPFDLEAELANVISGGDLVICVQIPFWFLWRWLIVVFGGVLATILVNCVLARLSSSLA